LYLNRRLIDPGAKLNSDIQGGQKVSHYQESSLYRIKNRP